MIKLDNFKNNEQNDQDVRDLRDNFKHLKSDNRNDKAQTSKLASSESLDEVKTKEVPLKKN